MGKHLYILAVFYTHTQKRGNNMLFYCLLCDELGEYFNVTIIAHDLADAIDVVRTQYPESGIVDIRKA